MPSPSGQSHYEVNCSNKAAEKKNFLNNLQRILSPLVVYWGTLLPALAAPVTCDDKRNSDKRQRAVAAAVAWQCKSFSATYTAHASPLLATVTRKATDSSAFLRHLLRFCILASSFPAFL